MPDPAVPTASPYELTLAQIEVVKDALHRKGVIGSCLRCNTAGWNVEVGHMVVAPLAPGGFPFQWGGYPVVILTCTNCGWVNCHSVKTLGVATELGITL